MLTITYGVPSVVARAWPCFPQALSKQAGPSGFSRGDQGHHVDDQGDGRNEQKNPSQSCQRFGQCEKAIGALVTFPPPLNGDLPKILAYLFDLAKGALPLSPAKQEAEKDGQGPEARQPYISEPNAPLSILGFDHPPTVPGRSADFDRIELHSSLRGGLTPHREGIA